MATGQRISGALVGMALAVAACGAGSTPTAPGPSATAGAPTSAPTSAPVSQPATATPTAPVASASPTAGLPAGLPPSPIVLVATRLSDGRSSLVVANPSGARTTVPVTGVSLGEVAARPGTTEVAATMTVCEVADQPCATILVAVDLSAGTERRLTPYRPGASDVAPAWSPDGSRLVFASSRAGDAFGQELYVIPAQGGDAVLLDTGLRTSQSPAWSPDGSTIAFVGMDADSRSGIFLIAAGGGQTRRLASTDGSTPLSWSPDGSRIAYQAPNFVQTGTNEGTVYAAIAIVGVGDGASTVLRATPSMNRAPAWSPDGSAIAFVLEEAGQDGQLALMDPDGQDVRLLGNADWSVQAFAWLP